MVRSRRARLAALAGLAALALMRTARAETPEEAFDRGCKAYEQGKWDEAADTFQALVRYGFADARLEYDLANAEFKRNHLGQAILHYERARRLEPADPEIAANLALARGRLRDVVEDPDDAGPVAAVRALQDRVGEGGQAWLTLLCVWAVLGIVTWCGSRAGGFTPGWSWALAGAILAAVLLAASWRATSARLAGTPRAVVMKPSVDALAGPGLNNASLFTLHEGTAVTIEADRDGWMQVALPNGLSGWIARDDATRI
jgi:tetratricopeptide (TPR) repeat protein